MIEAPLIRVCIYRFPRDNQLLKFDTTCALHSNRSGINHTQCEVANPIRGVLDMKKSEQHMQFSNESIKTKTKLKEREAKQKRKYHKARTPSPFDAFPDRKYLASVPKERHNICNTVLSGFGSPSVGPTNAAPKRLKLPTVTPGATSTLSISSAPLFYCRLSGPFSSPLSHAAINLQPPSHTVLCRALVPIIKCEGLHLIMCPGPSVIYISPIGGKTMR